MDKKRLAILEKAYAAEIDSALSGSPLHILQTRSGLAGILEYEGFLRRIKISHLGVTVEGYELTHAGRLAYCMTCEMP